MDESRVAIEPADGLPSRASGLALPAALALLFLLLLNLALHSQMPSGSVTVAGPAEGETRSRLLFENFAEEGVLSYYWQRGGDWRVLAGNLLQTKSDGVDVRLQMQTALAPLVITTRFRHIDDVGAGLFFDQTDANAGHLVRYAEDGNGLLWGYFDENNSFTGQGYAGTPHPGTEWHTLEVIRRIDTYEIHLDGKMIDRNIPRIINAEGAGLTTSQSAAEFDWISVELLSTPDSQQPPRP